MTPAYVLAALTVPFVGLLLLGEKRDAPWRGWAKGAASTGFIATAVAAGAADTTYGAWVLAALCLGWAGDIALVSAQRRWFLLGLGSFLLSHLTYIGAFATVRPEALVAVLVAAGLLVPAALVGRWLWPHLGADMRGPVVAYIAVITAMVAAAAGAVAGAGPSAPAVAALTSGTPFPGWLWPTAVMTAAVAFYLSDVSVARDRFVAPGFGNRIWGLPLYYAAQLLFALSTGWL
ncbi:MAG: lysoplasmalogenase [Actinobacteria bacterium]|nr:lysoplasmalogenase [Actinomycetota bacterium]